MYFITAALRPVLIVWPTYLEKKSSKTQIFIKYALLFFYGIISKIIKYKHFKIKYSISDRKGFRRSHDDQGDISTIRFLMSYCSIKHFSKWLMIKIYLDFLAFSADGHKLQPNFIWKQVLAEDYTQRLIEGNIYGQKLSRLRLSRRMLYGSETGAGARGGSKEIIHSSIRGKKSNYIPCTCLGYNLLLSLFPISGFNVMLNHFLYQSLIKYSSIFLIQFCLYFRIQDTIIYNNKYRILDVIHQKAINMKSYSCIL